MVYRNPSDVSVTNLELVNFDGSDSVDLRKQVAEINLYEDIMSNSLYGSLVIYDAIDMVQDLPIIGEETLHLTFQTPGSDTKIDGLFRVYKLSDRKRDKSDNAAAYTLHFTTKEYFEVLNKNIQKSYIGKSVSEMVKFLYDGYIKDVNKLKTITIEDTIGAHDIVISNQNPFKALNYLARRGESDVNPNSNFVFYEDHNGYHFKTVESMIRVGVKDDKTDTFYYKHTGSGVKDAKGTDVNDAFIIQTMTQQQTFDIMKNLMGGMYSDNTLTHDIIRKTYKTHSFDYVGDYDDDKHAHLKREDKDGVLANKYVSKKANFTSKSGVDNLIPTQLYQLDSQYIKGKNVQIRPKKNELFGMKKKSSFRQLDTIVISISVPGDHTRVPGDIISLRLPAATGVKDLQGPDKYYSGDYLITQVRHKINLDTYTTILQVVKESYGVKEIKSSPNKTKNKNSKNNNLNVDVGASA